MTCKTIRFQLWMGHRLDFAIYFYLIVCLFLKFKKSLDE